MSGEIFEKCYSCGTDCISTQFCTEETSSISMPKHLKVSVIANPAFWGFGSMSENVLISGWAFYKDGYYDFFDGYDETHFELKTCGSVSSGPYANEDRPDVLYRSVYTPTGVIHYGVDGYPDGIERGGAEVYLVDQEAGQGVEYTQDSFAARPTEDTSSCDTSDPSQVFKKYPENFGLGNKILFNNEIFKNVTGAWRLVDIDTPNPENIMRFSTVCPTCPSGQESGIHPTGIKQSLIKNRNFLSNYDSFQYRASGNYPYCLPDGSVVDRYKGEVNFIARDTGVNYLVAANISYQGGRASGIYKSSTVLLRDTNDNNYDKAFKVIDVQHSGTSTNLYLAGTFGQDNFYTEVNGSGGWVMANSHDPESCCSKFAYGIDNSYKRENLDTNYHNDFGRIFNNAKNLRQSNRFPENRNVYPLDSVTPLVSQGTLHTDRTYPSMSGDQVMIDNNSPVFEKELPYYGNFFEVDACDYTTRREDKSSFEIGRNFTCATKKNTLDVFPSCTTQFWYWNDCEGLKYSSNRIPRFGLVYRGANFYDTCKFDGSGLPFYEWGNALPTNMQQLQSGLAGLEISMFVNLGDVRGSMIDPGSPCSCEDPLGAQNIPLWDMIKSPVTFPSFPKFDLYPNEYGCGDLQYQKNVAYSVCDELTNPCCEWNEYDWACRVKQPYTTYGYIRSLCGQETDDRIAVISSGFKSMIQNGDVRNTTPGSGTNQPVYWEFENSNVMFSGQADGTPPYIGTGQYPFWGIADNQGRLLAPYFRNIPTSGSYTHCGTTTNFGYMQFDECGTAKSGWPTDNVPFLIEIDHDDSCLDCGTPQMEETNFTASLIGLNTEYSYQQGTPPSTGEGLSDAGGSIHGFNYCAYKGVKDVPSAFSCESGWLFPCTGSAAYNDFSEYAAESQKPYVGNTCAAATGQIVTLEPIKTFVTGVNPVQDGDLLLGWSTWGVGNSFVKLEGSGFSWEDNFLETEANISAGTRNGIPYSTYVSMRLACPKMLQYLFKPYPSGHVHQDNYYDGSDPITTLYDGGMGIGCQHHYPSADSDLQLDIAFCLVADAYSDIFNLIPEYALRKDGGYQELLQNYTRVDIIDLIRTYGGLGCNYSIYEYGCSGYDSGGNPAGLYPCGSATRCSSNLSYPSNGRTLCDCGACCTCGDVQDWSTVNDSWLGPCRCDCETVLGRITDWDTCTNSGTVTYDAAPGCNFAIKSYAFSGDFGFLGPINLGLEDYDMIGWGPYAGNPESACRWKEGTNSTETGIQYYITKPEQQTAPDGCGLSTPDCELQDCSVDANVGAGLCGYPIPSGVSSVDVIRRSCYPEIMMVSKVECLEGGYEGSGYKLHLAREYHTHDRTWYELRSGSCQIKAYGGYNYYYGDPSQSGCQTIPYAIPADSVTPAWPSGTPCLVHQPTGINANQDFLFTSKPVDPSGDTLWNYYNLFYESGFSTGNGDYLNSLTIVSNSPICPSSGGVEGLATLLGSGQFFNPVGSSGTLSVNARHSCLQDQTECGAELYCNKMFFPRRTHASGTIITKFGSMQTCTSNFTKSFSPWHEGYQDLGTTDLELETINIVPFVDTCDPSVRQEIYSPIGIDDTTIIIQDVLPLMGIDRSKFRYLNDVKSCIQVSNGCIPMWNHSDQSIAAGLHAPKTWSQNKTTSFGYYLDKSVAMGDDSCLLTPFKIMVDVDCCTSNVRRKNSNDDPSNLDYIVTDIPSPFCGGSIQYPPCESCEDSVCGGSSPRVDQPDNFTCVNYNAVFAKIVGTSGVAEPSGACLPGTGTVTTYLIEDPDVDYLIGCESGTPASDWMMSNCDLCTYDGCGAIIAGCCGDGSTSLPESRTYAVASYNGSDYLIYDESKIWGWVCNGFTYISRSHFESVDPAEDCCFADKQCGWSGTSSTCCQEDVTICGLLQDAIRWDGNCAGYGGTAGNVTAIDYSNSGIHLDPSCGCGAVMRYVECEDSNLKINLTQ